MPNPNVWNLFDLKGKVFFVAGGARDLGRDMAEALAEAHADGTITSRTLDSAQKTAAALAAATGQRIESLAMDGTDEASVERAVAAAIDHFGRIDILINNVGGGGAGSTRAVTDFDQRDRRDWDTVLNTNVTAPWLVARHVSRAMKAHALPCMGSPLRSIINIASIAGMVGRDRSVYQGGMQSQALDYAAAKAAVIGLTRDMAAYLGPHGIRVNAISPGGFQRGQPPEFVKAYSDKTILGRMGRDGIDLKGAALFLASDASAYVTGHNLVVDGGFTVWQ